MDRILIRDLELFAYHGVFEEEKKLGQKFVIRADLFLPLREAAMSGDLEKSVHYGKLCEVMEEAFTEQPHDLIETAAEITAMEVLERFPIATGIRLQVKKPWAPIHKALAFAAVEVTRIWKRAFIGLGSNLGERSERLAEAVECLEHTRGIRLKKQSTVTETKAWGLTDQPDFLNQVVEIETVLEPKELIAHLLWIETLMGRTREVHWGPRTIDLDLLYFEDTILDSDLLNLPHPYVREREFVLEPLAEIAPHFVDPLARKTIAVLLEEWKNK